MDNGQIFSEAGALKDDGSQYVKGAYSFVGDDGETYWVILNMNLVSLLIMPKD